MVPPLVAGLGVSREIARGLGRRFGSMPFNRRRVDRAAERVSQAFPDLDAGSCRELVLRGYEHLAMLAVEIGAVPRMIRHGSWPRHVELGQMREALAGDLEGRAVVFITGHCGNWEIVGSSVATLGLPMHAVYRPLDLKPLDDWVRTTRGAAGIRLIDKFSAADVLPGLLERGGRVAFVADQNAGDRGLFVPFFGRLASTYKTVALLALQRRAWVVVSWARRLGWDSGGGGPARGASRTVGGDGLRYQVDVVDTFGPEDYEAQEDPVFYITARYRRGIEAMVRQAPEQYLWMHRIWKSRPVHERKDKPFPDRLRRRVSALPWMDDAAVSALVDRSDRDRAWLAANGVERLP